MVTTTKDDIRDKEILQKKDDTSTTCIPLRYLCADFLLHLFSHGSRAAAADTSSQSPEEERKGVHHKESTSGEETTTSSAPHLGSPCSHNIGALQHHDCHDNRCTSCDDINESGDILATCLHLYAVDIKDGTCYMLNLPQPRIPTPTVFGGTTPTSPEWVRELRAYLNISQFEYINLLDFADDAEVPLTPDIMALQTEAGAQQHAKMARVRIAHQEFQDERALPQAERRAHNVIDQEIQQLNNDLDAQQLLQDAVTARVRRVVNFLVTSSCIQQNQAANQTTYFVDFSDLTPIRKCFDNSDINMLQELVYNNMPCYRALYIHNLDGQRCHNDNSFRSGYKTSQHMR